MKKLICHFANLEEIKKIICHFANFEQIKKIICHFANFEQIKKIIVILVTCFKSEKASHALENKKIFSFFV